MRDQEREATHPTSTGRDASALENLWAGSFGDAWTDRNREPNAARGRFWRDVCTELAPRSVLELGCGSGGNLRWLAAHVDPKYLWGVDINLGALALAADNVPGAGFGWAAVRELPFRDRHFDLTFTVGVLIHQPDETLPLVLGELVRCSSRWILTAEYFADEPHTKTYRGEDGVLFKRNYGEMLTRLFPNVRHVRGWEAGAEQGFDRTQIDIYERS